MEKIIDVQLYTLYMYMHSCSCMYLFINLLHNSCFLVDETFTKFTTSIWFKSFPKYHVRVTN